MIYILFLKVLIGLNKLYRGEYKGNLVIYKIQYFKIMYMSNKMKKPIIVIIGKVQPQYGEDIWHPELMLEDELTKKLFKEFVKQCK